MTESTPAQVFPTAAEALASQDNRKMFEMRFKGIEGNAYVIASTEHQAKMAMLNNVITVEKISAAKRSRMMVAAFSELLAEKKNPQLTLPGTLPEELDPELETQDAPGNDSQPSPDQQEAALDARSSPDEQVAAV
jgi:hypothetical protein